MSSLSLLLVTASLWQYVVLLYCLRAYNLSMLYLSRTIEVGADRFKIPDILFNPYLSQVNGISIICCIHVHYLVIVVDYAITEQAYCFLLQYMPLIFEKFFWTLLTCLPSSRTLTL
jgi:L-asparagine transporter-like permease